jgi:hypothetical protein
MVNPMSGELVRAVLRRGDPIVPHYFLRWPFTTDIYVPATRAAGQNGIGIFGLLNYYPGLIDFMTNHCADAKAATFNVVQVNGGGYDPGQHGHSMLRGETISSTADLPPARRISSCEGKLPPCSARHLGGDQLIQSQYSRRHTHLSCATFLYRSVCVALVSSSQAVTTMSATAETVPIAPEMSSLSLCSMHLTATGFQTIESLGSAARWVTASRLRCRAPTVASPDTFRAPAELQGRCGAHLPPEPR